MSLGFYVAEAWRGLRRAPGVALAAAFSLFAAWVVLAGTADALYNGWRFVNAANARKELIVLMKDRSSAEEDSALGARLRALDEAGSVSYVSRDSAWAQLTRELGTEPSLLEAVGANPLPASWRVTLKTELRDAAHLKRLAETVRQYPEVQDALTGGEWVDKMEVWVRQLTWVGFGFGGAVALGVVVLVMLTIRLSIMVRSDVLRVLRLLGAGEWFVRMPFVFEGLLLAAATSVLALLAVEGASRMLAGKWSDWAGMPFGLDLAFLGLALLLGFLGSLAGSSAVGRGESA